MEGWRKKKKASLQTVHVLFCITNKQDPEEQPEQFVLADAPIGVLFYPQPAVFLAHFSALIFKINIEAKD